MRGLISSVLVVGMTWAVAAAEVEPKRDWLDGPKPAPVAAPEPEAISGAIGRGRAFLRSAQNKNGSWGSAHRTKGLNVYAPVPGAHHAFRTAVTSLCLLALMEGGDNNSEGEKAIDDGEAWLFENLPHLRRATPTAIYNVWGHAYAIQTLVSLLARRPDDLERRQHIVQLIQDQMDCLTRYESVDGGWGYYDFQVGAKRPASSSISFVNGAALVALYKAKQVGIEPPEPVIQRAVRATQRQRKPDFSYLYGEYLKWRPMRGINRPGGSLGRSQVCNLALRLWGDEKVTDRVLASWLNRLFARNGWLSIGRKRPVPHEAWFQVAAYFYYFGHYYAALCIDQLPIEQRAPFQDQLAQILLPLQEKDGSWWDFPFYDYHQQYGTAFALMSLVRCRHARPVKPQREKPVPD